MDINSQIFFVVLVLVGVCVVGLLVVAAVQGIRQFFFNVSQPLITREACVVTKRTEVSGGRNNLPATTRYYVTFEDGGGSGLRQEFAVSGDAYGMLAEGDRGVLSARGTWYSGFTRSPERASH